VSFTDAHIEDPLATEVAELTEGPFEDTGMGVVEGSEVNAFWTDAGVDLIVLNSFFADAITDRRGQVAEVVFFQGVPLVRPNSFHEMNRPSCPFGKVHAREKARKASTPSRSSSRQIVRVDGGGVQKDVGKGADQEGKYQG
jgi:hypothetical protein